MSSKTVRRPIKDYGAGEEVPELEEAEVVYEEKEEKDDVYEKPKEETYFLIEEFKTYERYYGETTEYDVRFCSEMSELKKMILEGAKHNGKLYAVKKLELNVEVIE
ncbi:MAG: hypothetical protein ACE5J7_04000 [Candidatus Aenigmatarchaeota archaeon]